MPFILIVLIGFVVLLLPPADAAQAQESLEGMSCTEVAALPTDPAKLDDKQLFIAARANDFGICVGEDDDLAFKLYKAGAERGRSLMMIRFGHFYLNGVGTEPDAEKARYWFRSHALAHPSEKERA